MQKAYLLSRDPIFYATVAFFALLTTGLSSVLGQLRFLAIAQALALTVLLLIPLRHRDLRGALATVLLWLLLCMGTVFVVTWLAPVDMERTFENGFLHRAAYAEWYYANSPLPSSFASQPLASLVEVLGVTLGSLLTGGLVGAWFLMRMANLAAFSAASLLLTLPNPLWIVVALPIWSILQLIGGGGLLAVLAEPLVTGRLGAGIAELGKSRRRPLLIFGGLYVLGLLLELILPPFWHFTPIP